MLIKFFQGQFSAPIFVIYGKDQHLEQAYLIKEILVKVIKHFFLESDRKSWRVFVVALFCLGELW